MARQPPYPAINSRKDRKNIASVSVLDTETLWVRSELLRSSFLDEALEKFLFKIWISR